MKADRRVHAWGASAEVVRYEKAGKWYVEPRNGQPRQHVKLDDAAKMAVWLWYHDNGSVDFTRPGGGAFDAKVRQLVTP